MLPAARLLGHGITLGTWTVSQPSDALSCRGAWYFAMSSGSAPPPMRVASSGQSICLGEQQVTERLEPDRAAVEAADDAVDRSPLPDRHGVHTSVGRQPLRPGVQVVAGVGVASDDGAKVACSLRAQTHWIDQLERAVRRLEHVEVVDVAVYEHGVSVIVGAAATLDARESGLEGRSGTRLTRLLPQPRKQLGILACLVRARRKVNIGADRTPEPGSDVAQHVMPRAWIRHDVVQGSAESLEQDRATVEIHPQQARAAIAVGKAQRGGFEGEIPPSPRNPDLEDSRRPLGAVSYTHL